MVYVAEVLVGNLIQCTSCHKWVHKKCSGIKRSMYKVMRSFYSFICRGCLNPVITTGHTSVDIGASANLEVVDKFCFLGEHPVGHRSWLGGVCTWRDTTMGSGCGWLGAVIARYAAGCNLRCASTGGCCDRYIPCQQSLEAKPQSRKVRLWLVLIKSIRKYTLFAKPRILGCLSQYTGIAETGCIHLSRFTNHHLNMACCTKTEAIASFYHELSLYNFSRARACTFSIQAPSFRQQSFYN